MLANAWKMEHEHVLEVEERIRIEIFEIDIIHAGRVHACQVIFPTRPPRNFRRLTRESGSWSGSRLSCTERTCYKILVIVGPGLVVIVNGRKIRVMKYLQELLYSAACSKPQRSLLEYLSPTVFTLILPFLGIADSRLGLHVVEPHVLGTRPCGPNMLARDTTCVAADALVKIHHHGNLGSNLHTILPLWPSGRGSPHLFASRPCRSN